MIFIKTKQYLSFLCVFEFNPKPYETKMSSDLKFEELWDHWDVVIAKHERTCKFHKEFLRIQKKRIEVEERYAKDMLALHSSAVPHLELIEGFLICVVINMRI